jgi:LacI family kdg operon repressor
MKRDKTKITIADVAKRVGVSKTTISRFLNGKFEFMSEESKRRIQATIDELNYRPNKLARSLKSSKSRLIGLIVSDISNPFFSILVQGISDTCNQCGYQVLIANTNNDTAKEQEYILSMLDQRVEGFIVNTTGCNTEFLCDVENNHVPIILADRPVFPHMFDTVKADDEHATVELIKYLAQRGFSRVGFFSEPINSVGTRMIRRQAYRQACREVLQIEPQEYEIGVKEGEKAQRFVTEFAARNDGHKKAVFTANGVTMLNVLKAIYALGLRIPEDIAICGFENWPWMEFVGSAGLTAISLPSYEIGVECVNRIMFRLEATGKVKPETIRLPTKLNIRGSTG